MTINKAYYVLNNHRIGQKQPLVYISDFFWCWSAPLLGLIVGQLFAGYSSFTVQFRGLVYSQLHSWQLSRVQDVVFIKIGGKSGGLS
jgi:hypothetical protein